MCIAIVTAFDTILGLGSMFLVRFNFNDLLQMMLKVCLIESYELMKVAKCYFKRLSFVLPSREAIQRLNSLVSDMGVH